MARHDRHEQEETMAGRSLTVAPISAARRTSDTRAVVWIGLLAGTLDISEDLIFVAFHHITPEMVFRFIASGLIGQGAAATGSGPVVLGVLLHYFIALSWTAVFFVASQKLLILRRKPVISGLVYGVLVYLFMNLIVLPLSRIPRGVASTSLPARVNGVLAVVICIGLAIALLTRRRLGAPSTLVAEAPARPGRP
jgi:hypothetical protein